MRVKYPVAVLVIGTIAVSSIGAGCSQNAAMPQPAPSQSTSPTTAQPKVTPRLISHDRFRGAPTSTLRTAFREIDEFVQSHPKRFGGAFYNFNYSAIHVWTADEGIWQDPAFVQLRERLDPSGDLIANVGIGKPLTYLGALRTQLTTQFRPGPQSKIATVRVDPIYNAVRVQIMYADGDESLSRMPLALELASIAPEIVIESVGGAISNN